MGTVTTNSVLRVSKDYQACREPALLDKSTNQQSEMDFEVVKENYTPDKGEEVSKEGLELKYLEPVSVDSLVEPD